MKKLKSWENGVRGMVLCVMWTLQIVFLKQLIIVKEDVGDIVTVKYGKDMAYAEIVNP